MFENLLQLAVNDNSIIVEAIILFSAAASFMFTVSKARFITAKKDEIYSDLSRDFAKDVQDRNDMLVTQNKEFSDTVIKISCEIAEIKTKNEQLSGRLMEQEKLISLQSETIKTQQGKMDTMQSEIVRIQRQNLEYRAGINILFDQVIEAGITPRYRPAA